MKENKALNLSTSLQIQTFLKKKHSHQKVHVSSYTFSSVNYAMEYLFSKQIIGVEVVEYHAVYRLYLQ